MTRPLPSRAAELIATLGLQPHPEGGHYREIYRAPAAGGRSTLTTIDFLLAGGPAAQFSAWHQVDADEVWHLLEGDGALLWLLPPDLSRVERVVLGPVDAAGARPRHVVPAHWWQATEPLGGFAYVGATVAPGFEFSGFRFGRDDAALGVALDALAPALRRLL